jgi:hemoglobin
MNDKSPTHARRQAPAPSTDAIGGVDGMRRILQDFYDRLFIDPMIGFFFAGRDKHSLIEQQLAFTASKAFGMPIAYRGKSVADAHRALPILTGHFDRRHTILQHTLRDHQVPDDIQAHWLAFDRSFRRALLRHHVPR